MIASATRIRNGYGFCAFQVKVFLLECFTVNSNEMFQMEFYEKRTCFRGKWLRDKTSFFRQMPGKKRKEKRSNDLIGMSFIEQITSQKKKKTQIVLVKTTSKVKSQSQLLRM